MKKIILATTIILLLSFCINKQKNILVVSYNVENLFDTLNDPHTDDNAFTPNGAMHWNTKRYTKKIFDLSQVIASIDKKHLPDLIALIEVENASVINDLLAQKPLKKAKYKYIHYESSSPRGIDVALIYNPKIYKPIHSELIKIYYRKEQEHSSKEILMTKGLILKDTVFIFVNHWKSRAGGQKKTEYKRIIYAKMLKNKIDSIQSLNPNARIICLGDFNDTPTNKSLNQILNASTDSIFTSSNELFNLCAFPYKNNKGTYHYHDKRYMIDNIIVSQNFITDKTCFFAKSTAKVYISNLNARYNPKANDTIPYRTYGGRTYLGGISDHFPVYVYFSITKKCKK